MEEYHEFKRTIAATLRTLTRTKHLYVVFRGKQAETNGARIILPNMDVALARPIMTEDDLKRAYVYLTALRGYAYHEASHITETDLDVFELVGRQYGKFAHSLLNLFEDIRCEHRFGLKSVHIKEQLEFTRERYVWRKAARKIKRKLFHKRDLVAEWAFALQVAMKHDKAARQEHRLWQALSDEAKVTACRFYPILRDLRGTYDLPRETGTAAIQQFVLRLFAQLRQEHDSVADLWPVAIGEAPPHAFLVTVVDDVSKYLKSIEATNVSKSAKFQTYSVTASDVAKWPRFAGKPVAYLESLPDASSGIRPAGDVPDGCSRALVIRPPEPADSAQNQALAAAVLVAAKAMPKALTEGAEEEVNTALMEIECVPHDDKPYLVYTTEHDLFVDTIPATAHQVAALEAESRELYGPIARRLTVLLRVRTRSKRRGNQEEGETLDIANLYQILTVKKTGAVLRPFETQLPRDTLLETGVGVVIDTSGSMNGTRIELARHLGFCIGSALDQAGISFAMWGFTSRSTWAVPYQNCAPRERDLYARFGGLHVETVKDFKTPWRMALPRVPSLGSEMVANYDADSVRHCVHELMRARVKRRVLFVLSDGQPTAGEPAVQTGRQQHELRQVVVQARAAGVEVVGIGIQSEAVREYYNPMCVVVHTLADLPRLVLSEMEWLLLGTQRKRA